MDKKASLVSFPNINSVDDTSNYPMIAMQSNLKCNNSCQTFKTRANLLKLKKQKKQKG